MKRLIHLVAAVTVLAGCAAPGSIPPGPATTTPAAPTCPPEGVRMRMSDVNAAMGLRAAGIDLVNCGARTYRVQGYPVVAPLDEDQGPVSVQVLTEVGEITGALKHLDVPPQPVVLQPGESATAVVAWRNKYDDVRNPPVEVASLFVAPEKGRPAQLVRPDGPLDLGSTGRIGISPWIARKEGPSTSAETTEPAPPLL
ncbi:DUF4232 domain-containing protein [Actinoplanes sp. NPDC051861]|uniref:DUF4232 domain-containing protein n=1 Tax=Actinoplanes sp. NPDC051861 TaxID=3155170 RepID=UPI003415BED8